MACWALEHGYTYEWTIPCLTGHDKIAKDMIEMNDTVVKAKAGKKKKTPQGFQRLSVTGVEEEAQVGAGGHVPGKAGSAIPKDETPAASIDDAKQGAQEASGSDTAGKTAGGHVSCNAGSAPLEPQPEPQPHMAADKDKRYATFIGGLNQNEIIVQELAQKGRPTLVKIFDKPGSGGNDGGSGKAKRKGKGARVEVCTASCGRHGLEKIWEMMCTLAKRFAEGWISSHEELRAEKAGYVEKMKEDDDDEDHETPAAKAERVRCAKCGGIDGLTSENPGKFCTHCKDRPEAKATDVGVAPCAAVADASPKERGAAVAEASAKEPGAAVAKASAQEPCAGVAEAPPIEPEAEASPKEPRAKTAKPKNKPRATPAINPKARSRPKSGAMCGIDQPQSGPSAAVADIRAAPCAAVAAASAKEPGAAVSEASAKEPGAAVAKASAGEPSAALAEASYAELQAGTDEHPEPCSAPGSPTFGVMVAETPTAEDLPDTALEVVSDVD